MAGQHPFAEVYAAVGWHPMHRRLLQLLANATSAGCQGLEPGAGSPALDGCSPAALAAALLAAGTPDSSGGSSGEVGHGWGAGGEAGGPLGPHSVPPTSGGDNPSGSGGPVSISLLGLLLGALVIGVNGLISVWLRLGLHGKLAVATVRCVCVCANRGAVST